MGAVAVAALGPVVSVAGVTDPMAFNWATMQDEPEAVKPAPVRATPRPQQVQARYDNSLWTPENQRQWWMADYFSAKAANSFQVRRQLRMRSRYEVANNPYLFGVCNSNADDLIDKGPTLQCYTSNGNVNRQIEKAWNDWFTEVNGPEKLRTVKLAKTVDGEGFLILKSASSLENPVKLYPVDIEADQVTTPAPANLADLWVDGLTLDPVTGNPTKYHVLKHHPGDFYFPDFNPMAVEEVGKKWIVHWFDKFRPGQVRGIPTFTSSLDLFTELRSFRRSVVSAAQVAANFAILLESEAPANVDDDDTEYEPFAKVPIDRGMMATLPAGMTAKQMAATQPATTYEMFSKACLGEACRPLAYPLNLALGTSKDFNFSSAQLDHVNYRNSLHRERYECEVNVIEVLFKAWFEEAKLVPGLIPANIKTVADIPHEWHWPGFAPLDPLTEATTDHQRLSNGTLTWKQYWAARGYDWKDIMLQQEQERELIKRLGLRFGMPATITETTDVPEEEVDV